MSTVIILIVGLLLLTSGAELLVRGASALAAAARISPLVIGLTVVAYGTSTPELIVSVQSAFRGQADIALGNVVGSNIFNVLFILGISALIVPLRVSQQLIRFDVPVMIALSILVALLSFDGAIGFWDGLLFVAGLVAYTTWGIVMSRREQDAVKKEYDQEFGRSRAASSVRRLFVNIGLVAGGLLLLFFGSRWFTDASINVARELGISELVIGLTIVAAGTSLPEVATSVMAAFRGERDIAVGNVVGSNIFNIMGVLGLSGMISGGGITVSQPALYFDVPVMIAVAVACLPIFFTGHLIARWEGVLFLAYFFAYTGYLVLAETNPAVERTPVLVLLGFLLPLVVISVAVPAVRKWKEVSHVET